MIVQGVFKLHITLLVFTVPAIFLNSRDQLIGIIGIIVYLGRFKPNLINPYLFCQFFYILNLVFIWLYYQELEKYKRCIALPLLFPLYNIPCPFQHLIQFSAYPV